LRTRSRAIIRAAWPCSILAAALALAASGACSSSPGVPGTGGRGGSAGAGGSGHGGAAGTGGTAAVGGTGGGGGTGGSGGVGGGGGTGGSGGAGAAGTGGAGGGGGGGAGGTGGESAAFTIVTPDVTLQPTSTATACYYFHAQNASALAIKKWTSDMTSGTHHLIVYAGTAGQPADGLSTAACGLGTGTTFPPWLYASHTAHGELALPADDGTGKPVGMAVAAGQPMFIQIYFVNTTATALAAHVTLSAYAYPASTTYTQTDAFVTYNSMLSIPPGGTNVVASKTCSVPSGGKFWSVSTESHMQSTATDIKDGSLVLFMGTNWENPGAMTWSATPFYTFTSGAMTYGCTYNNTGSNSDSTIRSGSSFQTDEVCMGIGYFFPSTGPKFCLDSTSL